MAGEGGIKESIYRAFSTARRAFAVEKADIFPLSPLLPSPLEEMLNDVDFDATIASVGSAGPCDVEVAWVNAIALAPFEENLSPAVVAGVVAEEIVHVRQQVADSCPKAV
jgi:hypothetical protein